MGRYSSPHSPAPTRTRSCQTEPTPTIPAIKSVGKRQAIRAQTIPRKGWPPMLDNRLVEDSVWLRRLLRGVPEMQDEDNQRVLRMEGRLARVSERENWRNYARDLERRIEDLERKQPPPKNTAVRQPILALPNLLECLNGAINAARARTASGF
jgi:hypothetical protein